MASELPRLCPANFAAKMLPINFPETAIKNEFSYSRLKNRTEINRIKKNAWNPFFFILNKIPYVWLRFCPKKKN